MKINPSFIHILLIISNLMLISCAQQVPPNGGPKDEQAPKVVGSRPDNKKLNFEAKKITIQFDEYIQIKDPSQIVISPPLKEKPSISANGKQLDIEFFNIKPKENTTYTINFGASIVDIHEGTSLNNYSYVFSTGNYLDSNTISGIIETALERKTQKDIVVALYKLSNFTDSTLARELPDYFAKSLENGTYKIENLPNDSFQIFAFKDLNSNLKIEPNEPCGFINSTVSTANNTNEINLTIFEPYSYKQGTLVEGISKQKGKYQLAVYGLNNLKIEPLDSFLKYSIITEGSNGIDTINYFSTLIQDTLTARFRISNSDSIFERSIKTKSKAKLPNLKIDFEIPKKPTDTLGVMSNIPIETVDWTRLIIKRDTLLIKPKSIHKINFTNWKLVLPIEEGAFFQLNLKDSAMQSIFKQYNAEVNTTFSPKSEKDFGNLILDLTALEKQPLLLEIVEDKEAGKVVFSRHIIGSKILQVKNLEPLSYRIRFVKDTNNNGKWDRGILTERLLPEEVYYFEKPITIKSFWDIEQSIQVSNLLTK